MGKKLEENGDKFYLKVTTKVPFKKSIQIGDDILVCKNVTIENGDIVAVKLNSQVVLSRIKRVIRRYILIDYSSVIIDIDDRRILGKVVRVIVNC
ncbi:hypothetical protein BVG16_00075 [Paenibacillus selenitireducens]|uniref:Peptidase S24/S26A/S26B/S26C domain-containing protein n=2 Tax=Paenibacillus selenitireducens TaxID=1324314 RepID=A0A1T2XLU8_9BACL|nr:hypothetical protein [Paenibacillus selenitireducens]OPA80792.1 hypothetical protein BVG16_00075 [Paenibacillus selenitireducens]